MKFYRYVILILASNLAAFVSVHAELREKNVLYKDGAQELEGFLVEDDAVKNALPGVLVVHDWMGVSDNTKERARMLARLGYVAFAADIYGKNSRPKDAAEAGKMVGEYKAEQALMRRRAAAALEVLLSNPSVDAKRVAAIGYCFGGTVSLELARSGAALAGVVSFHGGLATKTPQDAKNIHAKILALHGADDPLVKEAEVQGFEDEMRKAGVDWQLVKYSGAVHAFTVKSAGNDNSKGAAYNATADRRSWQAMKDFFDEIFKPA